MAFGCQRENGAFADVSLTWWISRCVLAFLNFNKWREDIVNEMEDVAGKQMGESTRPILDEKCSRYFTYRNFIECGETQRDTQISNLPLEADSYLAIKDLATHVLDHVQDRYGPVKLTYGFSSRELIKKIPGRIAPAIDQHASHERKLNGKLICERTGAACDFIVAGADMREVAIWVLKSTNADRVYYYGSDKPVHVSHSSKPVRQFVEMFIGKNNRRMPKVVPVAKL
jgi:hypothetical protein